MQLILLSGGSGKRLWPLSNEIRSKQFLKIFTREDGAKESMIGRMCRLAREYDPDIQITVATSENQVPQIRAQLGGSVAVSTEPARRNTFPAIALACAYLKNSGIPDDEPVVVCPVDPYVDSSYFRCIKEAAGMTGGAALTLIGVEPKEPNGKYGYIIPAGKGHVSRVAAFKEKPDVEEASGYIRQGALWNAGVFAFRLSYMLGKSGEILGSSDYKALKEGYSGFPEISFDYAVAEVEPDIQAIRFDGMWEDLGTWDALSEVMAETTAGNAETPGCAGTHVINELGIPLIALGMKNALIAATPDGILVADKGHSPMLKDYVPVSRPMYEQRGWGEYRVLDYKKGDDGDNSLTKELVIYPGQGISYQFHRHRTEVWTVTEGEGTLILDGKARKVSRGDVAVIPPGMKHTIRAVTKIRIIEVQIGDELTEEDIERLTI